MVSDVRQVQSALQHQKKLKRAEKRFEKAQAIAKQEDFFEHQLRPAIRLLFQRAFNAQAYHKDSPNRIRHKYVGLHRQLVIRINDQPYGRLDRYMKVWITFDGGVITRRKFWAFLVSGSSATGVGVVFPAGIRIIPAARKSCDLDRSTQEAICEDVMARIRAM